MLLLNLDAVGSDERKYGLNSFRHKNSDTLVKQRRGNELSIGHEDDDLELFLEEEKRAYNEMKQNPDHNPIVDLVTLKADGELI